jgi:hypothetical protein
MRVRSGLNSLAFCKYVDNGAFKNSNDGHTQGNCEELEHLAVSSDGPNPQEADEQMFQEAPFIAVGF